MAKAINAMSDAELAAACEAALKTVHGLKADYRKLRGERLSAAAKYNELCGAVEMRKRLARMSNEEQLALAQHIRAGGIGSEESVGTPGS